MSRDKDFSFEENVEDILVGVKGRQCGDAGIWTLTYPEGDEVYILGDKKWINGDLVK